MFIKLVVILDVDEASIPPNVEPKEHFVEAFTKALNPYGKLVAGQVSVGVQVARPAEGKEWLN